MRLSSALVAEARTCIVSGFCIRRREWPVGSLLPGEDTEVRQA